MAAIQEQPASESTGSSGANFEASSLTAFRERARALLEGQRTKIRHVEANLSGQVAMLFEQVRRERQAALDQQHQLAQQLDQANLERETARQSKHEAEFQLSSVRDDLANEQRQQKQLRQLLEERRTKLETTTLELAAVTEQAGQASKAQRGAATENIERLTAERDELQVQLEAARQSLAAGGATGTEADSFRKRLEAAVQEMRGLKITIDELKAENAHLRTSSPGTARGIPSPAGEGSFDWEAQKRDLLRQLETDFDATQPEQLRQKLTVEGAIRITDQVVAAKDQEIEGLQQRLVAGNLAKSASADTAAAEMLSQDERIHEERERLRQLQDEWREKLRKAEVDISVERAKIARERVQMEEKLRVFERERTQHLSDHKGDDDKRPVRGKWLNRLGLGDDS